MPTVSVVIPTYKHRDFVRATLDSVFAQTYTDHEVIVVNDGSPDDTAEVLRPLVEAGRIRYIAQENQGQAAARNRGIAEAQGEFIALLDDDDQWPPDKLQWQVEALASHRDVGMVAGPADTFDMTGRHLSKTDFIPEIDFDMLFLSNPLISPGQTLIRTALLKELGGLNAQIWGADDWDLWFRIAKHSRILMKDRVALFYQVHPGNASGQLGRMLENMCSVITLHLQDYEPRKRRRAELSAYRFLWNYLAGKIVTQMQNAAKSGKIVQALSAFSMLLRMGRGLRGDISSIPLVIRDFTPMSLRRQVSRLRGRS